MTLGDLSPDFGSVYLGWSLSVHDDEPSDKGSVRIQFGFVLWLYGMFFSVADCY